VELPRLKAAYERFKDRGFQIVAIYRTRDSANATKFISDNGLPYRFVEDGDGEKECVATLFGIHLFPTSYLIDSGGKIVRVHVGFHEGDEKEYEKQIVELLDPPGSN
jgi:peroxiredoxin